MCMLFDGLTYKKYSRKVHQLIHGFLQGDTVDTWMKLKDRRYDVKLDYLALLGHYGCKGNKAVWIKESEALWTLLIYKR